MPCKGIPKINVNVDSWQIRETEDRLERLRNEKERTEASKRAVEARLQKCEGDLTEAGERYEERSRWLSHVEKEIKDQGRCFSITSHNYRSLSRSL